MSNLEYAKLERISMKQHPELNEKWLLQRIREDPAILGLGDAVVKDVERSQPHAGRLDLLLQDAELDSRYEVEIQLGRTDESHVIRTIEYWDIERKRYPQYEHTAVLVAEDITSRFLNVLSLFNGMIPLSAIQSNAVGIGSRISLVFTTVLDRMPLGLVDEDEDVHEMADRPYWEKRATPKTMQMTDELFEMIRELDASLEPKYNKFYIVPAKHGQPMSFVTFRPKKAFLRIDVRLKHSPEKEHELEEAGIDLMDYSKSGRYRMRFHPEELQRHRECIKGLIADAYSEFGS